MVAAALLPVMLGKLNERKNRLLQYAQVGMSQSQFEAFRKLLLDELGKNGYEKDLEEVLQHTERQGTGRNIQAGKEVPK
jgi:hypothetical protein